MKKTMIMMITLVFVASCAKTNTQVPLLIYDMNDAYMHDFESKLQEVGLEGYVIQTYDGQHSQVIQNEQIDRLLNNKHPLLIINPVDRLSAHVIIERAKASDTSIIFFNREPLMSDLIRYEKAFYVGADAIQSAQLQASLIMDLFGIDPRNLNQFDRNDDGIIQTIILKGQQGHQDAEARTKFVIDTLIENNYKVEVLEVAIANFDQQEGYEKMLALIDLYADTMEVVISNNDAMAIGAIQALFEKGLIEDINEDGIIDQSSEPWIPVVGIDGLDPALELIRSGHMYGTIKNDSQEMANIMLELAMWILQEKSLHDFPHEIENGQYVWVDYKKLSISE